MNSNLLALLTFIVVVTGVYMFYDTKDAVSIKKSAEPVKISTTPARVGANPNNYQCPPAEHVNCMPVLITEGQKKVCSADYLAWAKKSCTGFRGAYY